MEEFDVFTNEIQFTKTGFNNVLNKFASEMPSTPNGANYQTCKKLQAEESLAVDNDIMGTFYFTEAVSASIRSLAIYREEQLKFNNDDKLQKITEYVKPIQDLVISEPKCKDEDELCPFLKDDIGLNKQLLNSYNCENDKPFHKKYLKISSENNVDNFHKILKEIPKEWTVIQLTAAYNPNENLKPFDEFKTEISSIYVSLLTNEYFDEQFTGPYTIQVPSYVPKVGERALFVELYSLLDENYNAIKNAHSLNNKRLLRNYWDRREDVDLRMKGAISVMDRDWLGGWKCLLTGKLLDSAIKDKIKDLVDKSISDCGFIRLTMKQKTLLYNLIESSHWLTSSEIKSAIRKILTECGDIKLMKETLKAIKCSSCNFDYKFLSQLCLKCLSKAFETIHKFSLVDGIKAFSEPAMQVKENELWSELKMAKRYPVILIVDEMLDSFPWECLPILNIHPVSRMENIHFLHYLYKTHEQNITDGYFMAKPSIGRYVINPEKNLERMEKRMKSFVDYWCPDWEGEVSKPPEPDTFLQYIKQADLFLYCGHGSGCQLGGARGVQGARGRAAALLAGCGSVRLQRAAPAAHHNYHIAQSPMVVGMLWEVTDLEVDKVVSTLLSLCVPSSAPVPWHSVGKAQWSQGQLEVKTEEKSEEFQHEEDFLRAICSARRCTKFVMIASSIVARGIPIKVSQQAK